MSEHPVSRDSQRVPLEARVQLKFEWFGGFISEYSSNISPGGMFIRTQTPEPVGRMIGFELRLGDDYELIRGTGEVVWVRPIDQAPDKPAGMGIRFLEITETGRELIYRMVDNYIAEGGTPFDVSRHPAGAHDGAAAAPPAPPAPPAVAPPVSPPSIPEDSAESVPLPAAPVVPPPPAPSLSEIPPAPLVATPPPVEPPWPTEELEPEPRPEPVWPEPLAPAPPAPPVVPTFGVAVAEEAASRGRSRMVLWAALGGALVLATALAILNQDTLTGLFLPGRGTPRAAVPSRPPARRRVPAATPPPPAAVPPAAVPAAPPVAATGSPSPPPPAPPAETPAPPPQAVVALGTVTEIRKITWQQTPDGTEVVLWADGALRRQDWASYRIDGDPPRELVKLFGIRRPFGSPRLVVGTRQLLQVRVGYHDEGKGNELHVVLDLAGFGVEVTGIEAQGHELHIHLKGK